MQLRGWSPAAPGSSPAAGDTIARGDFVQTECDEPLQSQSGLGANTPALAKHRGTFRYHRIQVLSKSQQQHPQCQARALALQSLGRSVSDRRPRAPQLSLSRDQPCPAQPVQAKQLTVPVV